jgi:small subunit ribosomal protein S12|tara:strand:- start:121 stop:480 length:360 start_codon:yes stop_codon:yes gene_type:complete
MGYIIKLSKRSRKKHNNSGGFPQESGVCLKVLTLSPKKPNSANRRVCKIKLIKTKQSLVAKIPGERHTLQQHSTVLIRCGRSRDLIGVRNVTIRGKFDLTAVSNRVSSRSIYGIKNLKK